MECNARAAPSHRSAEWPRAALLAGTRASVLSTAALIALGLRHAGRPAAGINGPSQWLWGRAEKYRTLANWRNTASGYLIHHACSVLWACLFVSNRVRRIAPHPLLRAAAVTALAAAVDYRVVPRRFTPGFEGRLPRSAIAVVYIAFGAGLALGAQRVPQRAVRAPRRQPMRRTKPAAAVAASFLARLQR